MATTSPDLESPLYSVACKQYNYFLSQALNNVFQNSNGLTSSIDGNIIKINSLSEKDIEKLQFIVNAPPSFNTEFSFFLDNVTVTLADVTPNATFIVEGLKRVMNEFIQYNQINNITIIPNAYPSYVFNPFYNKIIPSGGGQSLIPQITDQLSAIDETIIQTTGHIKYYNLVFKITNGKPVFRNG